MPWLSLLILAIYFFFALVSILEQPTESRKKNLIEDFLRSNYDWWKMSCHLKNLSISFQFFFSFFIKENVLHFWSKWVLIFKTTNRVQKKNLIERFFWGLTMIDEKWVVTWIINRITVNIIKSSWGFCTCYLSTRIE